MEPEEHLSSVRGRLAMAREDAEFVVDEVARWDADEPWHIKVGEVELRRLPDARWGHRLGRAASEGRAALDALVVALVVANGGEVESHKGQFPVMVNYTNKTAGNIKSSLRGVSEEAVELITAMQPHLAPEPAETPLARLNQVANDHKHNDNNPAAFLCRGFALAFEFPIARRIHVFGIDDVQRCYRTAGVQPRPLRNGDSLLDHLPPQPAEKLRPALGALAEEHGENWRLISVFARLGVGFGPRPTWADEVLRTLEFVEDRVVAALAPLILRD